jgi:hypothetical protein
MLIDARAFVLSVLSETLIQGLKQTCIIIGKRRVTQVVT